MKVIFPALLLLTAFSPLVSQHEVEILPAQKVCELYREAENSYIYRPYHPPKRPQSRGINFVIDYKGPGDVVLGVACATWDSDAKDAFEYALGIWAANFCSDEPVNVDACWSQANLGGLLGVGGTNYVLDPVNNVATPIALHEALIGGNSNGANPDVFIAFNSGANWYLQTDANPPAGKIDFPTVALHEMGHGLGIAGAVAYEGVGPCSAIGTGVGCMGFDLGGAVYYTPYSEDAETDDGTAATAVTTPSTDMGTLLTGGSLSGGGGGFFMAGPTVVAANGGAAKLYTPSSFSSGSSYSHLDDAVFPNELFQHALAPAEAFHTLGLAQSMMIDMGWPTTGCASLPVELVDFQARLRETGEVALSWQTASEIFHEGFQLLHSLDGRSWRFLTQTPAKGEYQEGADYLEFDAYPFPGLNYYLLREVDGNGRISDLKVAAVEVPAAVAESVRLFPNPAEDVLQLQSGRGRNWQTCRIADLNGRVLIEMPVDFSENPSVSISLPDMPAGVYLLQLSDGLGVETLRFVKR